MRSSRRYIRQIFTRGVSSSMDKWLTPVSRIHITILDKAAAAIDPSPNTTTYGSPGLRVALLAIKAEPMAKSPIAERRRGRVTVRGSRTPQAAKLPYSLTAREIEVLGWVARGKSASAIGETLDITKRTVDAHVSSIVSKIGAMNRTHAVALAICDRLIKI
jgi:DNA-binding CsgD family transcriptional regulator